jgi:geranylgeranyl reductase family protein
MTLQIGAQSPTLTDIAIVGAGPAGAAAACHFARAGFRVALLDQRHFPRDKVCGDFVGPRALAELDWLGVSSRSPIRDANRIRRGALSLDGRKVAERPFPKGQGLRDHGRCIPRVLLDDAIVQAAVASGACLIEEARVTGYETDPAGVTLFHQGSGGQSSLRTRLLIGADGSTSLISRIVRGAQPLRRDRSVAVRGYFEGVSGSSDLAELYVRSSSLPGYYWLFPTGTDSANVGVEMLLEAWPPTDQQLGRLLTQLIEADPAIRSRLAGAKLSGKIVGWPLATFNPRLPIIADRVALIGDAAGMINPLNGEGIQYALRSARWSLEALRGALSSDQLSASGLRPYAARVQSELRFDMALSRFIIDVLRYRTLNPLWLAALELVAKRAAVDSDYGDAAAGVFAGVAPARDILAPAFLWRTVKSAAGAGFAAAIAAPHGERRVPSRRATLAGAGAEMIEYAVRHPAATFDWSLRCALGALELSKEIAIAALMPDRSASRCLVDRT